MRQKWCEEMWGVHAHTNPSESCNMTIHHNFSNALAVCCTLAFQTAAMLGGCGQRRHLGGAQSPSGMALLAFPVAEACVTVRGDTRGCTARLRCCWSCSGACNACSAARARPGTRSVSLCPAGTNPEMPFPGRSWPWGMTVPARPGTPSRTLLCPRMPQGLRHPNGAVLLQPFREDTKKLPETDCTVSVEFLLLAIIWRLQFFRRS